MDTDEKIALLKLARESIKTFYNHKEPDINDVSHLKEKQGVFVTLHKKGSLRGCIGFPEPLLPLYKAIIESARNAAFNDPRFHSVDPGELSELDIEISVLTVPKLMTVSNASDYKNMINIDEDGLIIRGKYGSGLLLPQVATEYHWTATQFLNALCQKAGLPFSSWQDLDNKIYKFQAEIFSEKELLKQKI